MTLSGESLPLVGDAVEGNLESMGRRSFFTFAIVVCVQVLLGGCSAFENLEREGTVPVKSAERARLSLRLLPAEAGAKLPRELVGFFEGEVVESGEKARLTFDIPSIPGGVPGPDIEFIFITDGRVYVRPIADAETMPKGKEWVLVQASQLPQIAPGIERYVDFMTNDRFLQSKSFDEDDEVGTDTVRGVATTVYSSSASVDDIGSVVGLSPQELAEMRGAVGDEARFKFWLDSESFIRRMEMPFSMSADIGNFNDPLVIRIELYDYDGDFDVTIPPESEVVEE